ncbi:uncharacterized protein moto [Labrus mixtus]|uniref:uncharacterized protein moto n=1 Tax=Labrus mixtus TaxID=508554 RepID=UPI0029C0880D|nr:uncharacterized protein moto [Labrus mixtus]
MPRSQSAHDDPYGLINYAQSNIKSRSLPTCNPHWSPLTEELLECSQSGAKSQQNQIFPTNYVSSEALSKTQGQSVNIDLEEFFQQWHFNLPNGDRDIYTHPQKVPSGRPMLDVRNAYLSQIQQRKHDYTSPDNDRGNGPLMNHYADLSNVLKSENEKSPTGFHPHDEDQLNQSRAKPISNDQYTPQDINQLVYSLQSFIAGENDSLCLGDIPNMHRQTVAMNFDDSMGDQYKISPSDMSPQTTSRVQIQKQLGRQFGTEQIERNGGAHNQSFNHHAYLDLPGFSPQNTDFFEQPKPPFASLNYQNRYQNKMTMHRQNASIPNIGMKQFTKQQFLQAKIQGKIKPPMQEEKKRMLISSFLGEGDPARLQSNTDMRGDEKQGLSKNLYFDPMGNMQFKRIDDDSNIFSAGNTQQLLPFSCPVNDPRRMPSVTINSSNFSSRFTQPYGRAAPGMDAGDMVSTNESAAFNSYVSDVMSHRGESTYHGMSSSIVMNQGGPVFQLNFYLDECYEQWKCLEKEREQIQAILSMTFHGKKTAAMINTNIPKTPQNPTRVDHLIVKNMREQARVASLLDRMECLHNIPLHTNIHTALNRHNMAISITQARRKEEIDNMSKQQRQRAHFTEDRDTLLLVFALKDLAATTRKLRTALWCAHQMTLPKPVKRQEKTASQEPPHSRRSPSPLEGYSF